MSSYISKRFKIFTRAASKCGSNRWNTASKPIGALLEATFRLHQFNLIRWSLTISKTGMDLNGLCLSLQQANYASNYARKLKLLKH